MGRGLPRNCAAAAVGGVIMKGAARPFTTVCARPGLTTVCERQYERRTTWSLDFYYSLQEEIRKTRGPAFYYCLQEAAKTPRGARLSYFLLQTVVKV